MNIIRGAIGRMADLASHGFPNPPTTLPQLHHAFANLETGVEESEPREELVPFLRRCATVGIRTLRRSELNRLLRGVWCDAEFEGLGLNAIECALQDRKNSTTKALIDGYLLYFPMGRPAMEPLAEACRHLVEDQGGYWLDRHREYRLFDPANGPASIGQQLAENEEGAPASMFVKAGLGLSPFATSFGHHAFADACRTVAVMRGQSAYAGQDRLLDILEGEGQFDNTAAIVRALLEPWTDATPAAEHRQRVTAFLLERISDPRVNPGKRKWNPIHTNLSAEVGAERAGAIIQVLRRWLTDVAMRVFFTAIAETTDRPDMWDERKKFWLAYLDAGHISDAWPALGARAKLEIAQIARSQGESLEHGEISSGPSGSSSLIMQIGDLRISEWSDTGRCRFWDAQDGQAPKLYDRNYRNEALRTMSGNRGFESLRHDKTGGWRYRFANTIYRRTGIEHPRFGKGHA
ncbi:hypothetical protein I5E68_15610 [Novosphingobium sp. YJ-S2-02]|uniref:Zorya protein ZorC EH domain-containing protein n=1 Tax=Novosphingobium aureum TaxID=2792964 RepID=A0A931HE04_9SPHN|nr:EH signature domain-containing protein [Novosphingobium aureum]MBH0114372.1 hypothetical protein [Novosphingobium aureum]